MGRPALPLLERFDRSWIPEPNSGCWIWIKEINIQTGYGVLITQYKRTRKKNSAHRISWMLYRGPIPDGLHVLHRCDTRCCVNPEHLFLGTNNDNIRDMRSKNRHCKGESAGLVKLTESAVREIRGSKEHYASLADKFHVAPLTVWDVIHNKTWRHIN